MLKLGSINVIYTTAGLVQLILMGEDNEFNLKYDEIEMPVSNSSRVVKQVIEHMELVVKINMWASSVYIWQLKSWEWMIAAEEII